MQKILSPESENIRIVIADPEDYRKEEEEKKMHNRLKRSVISVCTAFTLILPSVPVSAAQTQGAYVKESSDKIEIGNSDISRTILIEDGQVLPGAIDNERIDRALEPQEGSELFLLNTVFEAEGEETLPQNTLERAQWQGEVSCENSGQVKDAALMFDGNKDTDVDYYVKGTEFPYTLTIDLGQEETFQSFGYQKRKGDANAAWGINGTVGKYSLEVSSDGKTWMPAGSGEFTREDYNLHVENGLYNVGDMVYGCFDQEYTARYVRFICQSGALSAEKTFNGAEFYLYSDAYVPLEKPETEIRSSSLTLADTVVTDTQTGGKKADLIFEPYVLNGITWNFTYSTVIEPDEHYMRSWVEVSADKEDQAQIDYLDLDHLTIDGGVEGLWYRPDDFKVSEGAYNFLHTEMLLGEPIYAEGMFFGSEFPAVDTKVEDSTMQVRYYCGKTLAQMREENRLTTDGKFVSWPNVAGAAQGTDTDVVQTDFFDYIDAIATETSFRKQYNSWYDNRMGITDDRIAATFNGTEKGLAQQGYEPLDSYVVDDGWNNYNDPVYTGIDVERSGNTYNQTGFWEFNDKLPNELYTANEMADKFGSTFGLWLGPQGGYELQGTFSQYIESSGTGYVHPTAALGNVICTGSEKYIRNLTNLFTDYQERFDIDYWKLDGFASRPCTQEDHDHMTGGYNNMYFTSELWENWTDAFEAMRAQRAEEGKDLYINATCYAIPSPWLLQWVNAVWQHNAGDLEKDGTNGGSDAQKMISGRDNIYFRNAREAQLQFPLKNVYNHEPIYGSSAGVEMNTEEFRQYMMANAVRGVSFWELYFSPSMMDEAKWQVTADVLTFAEENEEILQHAKLFGNAPKTGSVYGYSSWNGEEGIVSFRNPTSQTKTYELKLDELAGVTSEVQDVHQIQILPYSDADSSQYVSYGDTVKVTLQPYEEQIYQFTNEKAGSPELVYAKVTDQNTIRIKFDKRVADMDVYQINGKHADAVLMDDYRTVELTSASALEAGEEVTVSVNGLDAINGSALKTELVLSAYEDQVIASVSEKDDLKNAEHVTEQVFERNGETFLALEKESFALSSGSSLDENTKDFTVSMMIQTSSKDAVIFQQENGPQIGIDEEGYLYYKDGCIELSSRNEVTTVVEKASGRYGTEEYTPTTAETAVEGLVSDGNKHAAAIVRELNGMVKLYLDGSLAATAYADGTMADFQTGTVTVGSESLRAQIADVMVYNRALGYDEVKEVYDQYRLDAGDIKLAKDGWKAEADSEEKNGASNEGPAAYAIDDDTATFWHTDYKTDKPVCPHWLMIDLGERTEFDKLEYVSRNGNGSVRDYVLEISGDGETWTTAKEGEMPKDGTTVLTFDTTQTARYIRLTIHTSYGVNAANENIFGAVAEISLYKNNTPVTDYSQLGALLGQAEQLKEEAYTPESWEGFAEALVNAQSVYRDVNAEQTQADQAAAALEAAMGSLVLKDDTQETPEPEEPGTDDPKPEEPAGPDQSQTPPGGGTGAVPDQDKAVQTGDSMSPALWAALMGVLVCAVAATSVRTYRRKK